MIFLNYLLYIWYKYIYIPCLKAYNYILYKIYRWLQYRTVILKFNSNNSLNLVVRDRKTGSIISKNVESDDDNWKVMLRYSDDKEFRNWYDCALLTVYHINKKLIPNLKKYYLKSIKRSFKNSNTVYDFLYDTYSGCRFEYKDLVNKILVPVIKKTKFIKNFDVVNDTIMKILVNFNIAITKTNTICYLNLKPSLITKADSYWYIVFTLLMQQFDLGCMIMTKHILECNHVKTMKKYISIDKLMIIGENNPNFEIDNETPDYMIMDALNNRIENKM